jgi:hypothetical protein
MLIKRAFPSSALIPSLLIAPCIHAIRAIRPFSALIACMLNSSAHSQLAQFKRSSGISRLLATRSQNAQFKRIPCSLGAHSSLAQHPFSAPLIQVHPILIQRSSYSSPTSLALIHSLLNSSASRAHSPNDQFKRIPCSFSAHSQQPHPMLIANLLSAHSQHPQFKCIPCSFSAHSQLAQRSFSACSALLCKQFFVVEMEAPPSLELIYGANFNHE